MRSLTSIDSLMFKVELSIIDTINKCELIMLRKNCRIKELLHLFQLLHFQVEDELHLIFKVLGTPTEDNWPGINR